MTDEAKALAFLNDVCAEMGLDKVSSLELDMPGERALLRAIEQHEAFRQEVSDAVEHFKRCYPGYQHASLFDRFILPKPDPLAEAMQDWWDTDGYASIETFRAAIEARGGRIVWEGE